MIRTRHIALNWGYDIATDCPFSFTLALIHRAPQFQGDFCYRLIAGATADWPKVEWYDKNWILNEPGFLPGVPIPRTKRLFVTVRRITWYRKFWWMVSR